MQPRALQIGFPLGEVSISDFLRTKILGLVFFSTQVVRSSPFAIQNPGWFGPLQTKRTPGAKLVRFSKVTRAIRILSHLDGRGHPGGLDNLHSKRDLSYHWKVSQWWGTMGKRQGRLVGITFYSMALKYAIYLLGKCTCKCSNDHCRC